MLHEWGIYHLDSPPILLNHEEHEEEKEEKKAFVAACPLCVLLCVPSLLLMGEPLRMKKVRSDPANVATLRGIITVKKNSCP
jgi:hypothetical protein